MGNALLLVTIYLYFHINSLYSFNLCSGKNKIKREIIPTWEQVELWFLCTAFSLIAKNLHGKSVVNSYAPDKVSGPHPSVCHMDFPYVMSLTGTDFTKVVAFLISLWCVTAKFGWTEQRITEEEGLKYRHIFFTDVSNFQWQKKPSWLLTMMLLNNCVNLFH